MQDIQDQLRAWMAAGFEKRGRGSKRELAHRLGIGEAAISKMLRPEKGKGFQTIELVWVPAMEEFFGLEAPVSLQLRTPSPTQDNAVPMRHAPAGDGQCVGAGCRCRNCRSGRFPFMVLR